MDKSAFTYVMFTEGREEQKRIDGALQGAVRSAASEQTRKSMHMVFA